MSNLSTLKKQRNTLSKNLAEKRLTYKCVNFVIDLYIKILVEECKTVKENFKIKPESSMFFDRCFEYLIDATVDSNNYKIIDSANRIRDAYESFLVALCFEHKPDFNFDMNLRTENTREFVIENTDVIFGEIKFDYYDGIKDGKSIHEIKYFYDWISKIIHPTTLKIFVMQLEKDKVVRNYYKNIFKENIFYMVMIILTYFENQIMPSDDDLIFHKDMIKSIIPAHFINLIYFCSSISKEKLSNYSILFNTETDKKYIENVTSHIKKSKDELEKNIFLSEFNSIDGKFVEETMRKKGYYQMFSKEINEILKSR